MMEWISYAAKAVFAGLVAFLGGLAAILVGDASLADVTVAQWITVALSTLLAVGGVFGLTNGAKPGTE